MSRTMPGALEQHRRATVAPGAGAEHRRLVAAPGEPLSVTARYGDGRHGPRPDDLALTAARPGRTR